MSPSWLDSVPNVMPKTRPQSLTQFHRSNYRLLGLVGRGQFGRVSCAIHRQTGQLVALKELDQQFPTHQFLRELRFLLTLQHPNIVTCWACEHSTTGRYLVTDYCEGGTLRQLMDQLESLPTAIALEMIVQILAGLDHAHHLNILHCDIKPENILLTLQPQGWIAKLTDFGIARLTTEAQSPDQRFNGSPAYMAPERFYGQYSATTDVYAVGILLYELLVGDRPFTGTPGKLMTAHLNQTLTIPAQVPTKLHPIIRKALAKLPAQRYQNAGEMLLALRNSGLMESEHTSNPQVRVPDSTPASTLDSSDLGSSDLLATPDQPVPSAQLHRPETSAAFQHLQTHPLQRPLQGIVTGASAQGFSILQWDREQLRVVQTNHPQGNWTIALETDVSEVITEAWVFTHQIGFRTTQGQYNIQPSGQPSGQSSGQPSGQTHLHTLLYGCQTHSSPSWTAIAPQGKWSATLQVLPEWEQQLSQSHNDLTYELTLDWLQRQQAPICHRLDLPGRVTHMLTLDHRHLGIFSQSLELEGRNVFSVISRRGQLLGRLELGFMCDHIVAGIQPYQCIATELDQRDHLLWINLKPFQVRRIPLTFLPEFQVATPWGYVLCDRQGQGLALNLQGEVLTSVQFPSGVTAIAPLGTRYLLVATDQQGIGQLLTYCTLIPN
ncbi:MAG: serine/threonine-protein kinase [Synechococcales bacterium]|nr:serine/threonine-protein kinase [Synechococcales bacterium]